MIKKPSRKRKTPLMFTGATINGIIFYQNQYGTWCARTKPTRVRQTKATKAAAKIFGRASRCAAILYNSFRGMIPNAYFDLPLFNNCRAQMVDAFKNRVGDKPALHLLNGYIMVQAGKFRQTTKPEGLAGRNADGMPFVKINGFTPSEVRAPKDTTKLRIRVMSLATDEKGSQWTYSKEIDRDFDYNDQPVEAQEIYAPLDYKGGQSVLMGYQIQFLKQDVRAGDVVTGYGDTVVLSEMG